MFSLYTQEEYLRARRRQERIADRISIDSAGKKTIHTFLLREERLQAYEFVNCKTGKDAIMKCLNKEEGVVNFYFSYCYKKKLFIVMEFCEKGDLENYLKNNKEEAKQNYKDFSLQILNILKVLRNKKIIHRDIKPENFIMKKKEDKIIIKLCDFGTSAISEGKSELYIGYHKYKSNIFKQWYIKYNKERDQKAFFNPFNEDLFSAAIILHTWGKSKFFIRKVYKRYSSF